MKKFLLAVIAVALIAVSVTLCACGGADVYVNISGNYENIGMNEAYNTINRSGKELSGSYEMYYFIEMRNGRSVNSIEMNGLISFSEGKVRMSADGTKRYIDRDKTKFSVYSDGTFVYLKTGESKEKCAYALSNGNSDEYAPYSVSHYLPTIGYKSVFSAMQSGSAGISCAVAETDAEIKFRINVGSDILDLNQSFSALSMPLQLYIISNGKEITGMAAKGSGDAKYIDHSVKAEADIRLNRTNEAVTLPSDLAEYELSD